LKEKEFSAWQKEAGEPEPGYDEWFCASVEEALADTSGDVPHEVVVKEIAALLRGVVLVEGIIPGRNRTRWGEHDDYFVSSASCRATARQKPMRICQVL